MLLLLSHSSMALLYAFLASTIFVPLPRHHHPHPTLSPLKPPTTFLYHSTTTSSSSKVPSTTPSSSFSPTSPSLKHHPQPSHPSSSSSQQVHLGQPLQAQPLRPLSPSPPPSNLSPQPLPLLPLRPLPLPPPRPRSHLCPLRHLSPGQPSSHSFRPPPQLLPPLAQVPLVLPLPQLPPRLVHYRASPAAYYWPSPSKHHVHLPLFVQSHHREQASAHSSGCINPLHSHLKHLHDISNPSSFPQALDQASVVHYVRLDSISSNNCMALSGFPPLPYILIIVV